MAFNLKPLQVNILIILAGSLLFLPFLGSVHLFDWDENIFAESAREMIVTGNFLKVQSNFMLFHEKPPFFFWMQAAAMTVFGMNEFAARFPNAVVGVITLLLLYNLGRKFFSHRFGMLWALCYLGSFLPHFYFRTALIDPTFNLFIFSGVFTLAVTTSIPLEEKRKRFLLLVLAGLLIGFAILTKGPVALLITALTAGIFILVKRDFKIISVSEILIFLFFTGFVSALWFGIEALVNGPRFIEEFISYQIYVFNQPHSGHDGPFFFHFVVLLLGCFPVSFLIFKGIKAKGESLVQKNIRLAMIIIGCVVLVLFSIVRTKLVHYSSLCYFPIAFFGATALEAMIKGEFSLSKTLRIVVFGFGLLISSVLFLAVYFFSNLKKIAAVISPYVKDPFALGNMEADIPVAGWEVLPGILFLAGTVLWFFTSKKKPLYAVYALLLATVFTVQAGTYSFIPKVESLIQGAAIDFYREKGKEDAYLATFGFKSFAYLFYGEKKPGYLPHTVDQGWLLHGEIDKPVYIVSKNYKSAPLDSLPAFNLFQRIINLPRLTLYLLLKNFTARTDTCFTEETREVNDLIFQGYKLVLIKHISVYLIIFKNNRFFNGKNQDRNPA